MSDATAIVNAFSDAWNQKDAVRLGKLFGEDATFINVFGIVHEGREKVTVAHVRGFDHEMKASTLTVRSQWSRPVNDSTVMLFAEWTLSGQTGPQQDVLPPKDGIMTVLATRNELGKWLIHTLHNELQQNPPH